MTQSQCMVWACTLNPNAPRYDSVNATRRIADGEDPVATLHFEGASHLEDLLPQGSGLFGEPAATLE